MATGEPERARKENEPGGAEPEARRSAAGERGGRRGAEPGAGGSAGAPALLFRNQSPLSPGPQFAPPVPCSLIILIAANDKRRRNSGKQRRWKLLPRCE